MSKLDLDLDIDAEDDQFDSLADVFETSYNHRYEEPSSHLISSHPRTLPSLLRREDTKRKESRARRKERKALDLLRKKEEVRKEKGEKMRSIREKLEMIRVEGGKDVGLTELVKELEDEDEEWDPEKHDSRMADAYGGWDGDDGDQDDSKPAWASIADEDETQTASTSKKKKDKKKKSKKSTNEDEDGIDVDMMDADFVPAPDMDEEWDGTEEMRKRKLNEYMDELYALEFNDLVSTSLPPCIFFLYLTVISSGRRHAHPFQIHTGRTAILRTNSQ